MDEPTQSNNHDDQMEEGIAQDILGFTAQVRRGKDEVIGTAFAVSRENALLMTCHHVARDAIEDGKVQVGAALWIYFQQIRGKESEKKLFPAHVHAIIEEYDDDLVLLKLDSGILPSDVQIAILGNAKGSVGRMTEHRFRSFGYQKLGQHEGFPSRGIIIDFAMPADNHEYKSVTLETQGIDAGMSGAAVLDFHRNLVVGVVSETSVKKLKNHDISFAVQSDIAHDKWDIELHPEYRLKMTQSQAPNEQAKKNAAAIVPSINFPLAPTYKPTQPPELPEWAGRVEFLEKLDKDYVDSSVHITGLIGLGGEGKSSIAYRWLTHNALQDDNQPDAAFWWSFYENRSFEQMVEALTSYLYGEQNLGAIKGTAQRVNHIGAMALTKTLILVLDGFEVMQEEKGDKYGSLPNKDLLQLLQFFAQSRKSFCLVTSRVPLLDFLNHSAYVQRDVTRLTESDGRQLLRNLKIEGNDTTLDKIVSDWEGHALTVGLVGSYLRDQNIVATKYNIDLFPEIADYGEKELPRYKRVRRILQRYDQHLTEADKAFLKLFSVFRLPVADSAFGRVFRADTGSTLNTALHSLDDTQFEALVAGLVLRRLLRRTEGDEITYSAHPLVQRHYRKALEDKHKPDDVQPIHRAAAEHYQETNDEPGHNPTLDDLKPYIEVVYHLCRAGAYDEASNILWQRILQGERRVLYHVLGAYETYLNLLLEFFPDSNLGRGPQVSKDSEKSFILNEVGLSLMNLGRLHEATSFYERAATAYVEAGKYDFARVSYQNLAELYKNLGQLIKMQNTSKKSLFESEEIKDTHINKHRESSSMMRLAQAKYLRGEIAVAKEHFQAAEMLEIESGSGYLYLYGQRGNHYSEYLRRSGDRDVARRLTETNLQECKKQGWITSLSRGYRILGDLEADAGNHVAAAEHYEQSLTIAGQIDAVDIKIEALLARGCWFAKHKKDAERAFADLDVALSLALQGGYRLYEADIRVALAWAYKAQGDEDKARSEAYIARGMSEDMGYYWGQVDAKEVLEA